MKSLAAKTCAWMLLAAASGAAFGAGEVAPGFTLDGTLYDSTSGTSTLHDTAVVRVQVLNPAKTCVLYDEQQTVNTTASDGAFSIQVGSSLGSGRRVAGSDSGNTMVQIFQNKDAITGNNGGCSYTPAAGDIRYARVFVTPAGTGVTDQLNPDMTVGSVPAALVADSLQGVSRNGFLQLGAGALSQTNVETVFTTANFSALSALLSGGGGSSSGNYVIDAGTGGSGGINFNVNGSTKASIAYNGNFSVDSGSLFVEASSNRVGIGTTAPAASLDLSQRSDGIVLPAGTTAQRPSPALAGMIRFNASLGRVEFHDGTVWATIGTDISGISAGGDLSGTYPNPTVARLQGTAVSGTGPNTGEFLKYNGTNWAGATVKMSDLTNATGSALFSSPGCTAAQSLYWDSGTDTIRCQSIGSLNASVLTAGTIDSARLPSGATAWEAATGGINYPGGNVAIGTTTPQAGLDVRTTGESSALIVPRDTVANRPTTAVNGMIRYASDTNALEAYVNGGWTALAGLAGNPSFAGNVTVGGSFTSTGAATFNGGATVAGGPLVMSSQNITGVGSNITAASALTLAAGGTNQNLSLNASGTGNVNLGSGNGTSLAVLPGPASTVNYVTIKGSPTGASPSVGVDGTDTNIDLTFNPKGTGRTVFSSGNVGVGTSAPSEPLAVKRDLGVSSAENHIASFTRLGGSGAGVSIGYRAASSAESGGFVRSVASLPLVLGTSGVQNVLSLSNTGVANFSGNVGLGSASPAGKLDVTGTVNAYQYFTGYGSASTPGYGTYGSGLYYDASGVGLSTGSTERIRILAAGNVGIGSATPGHALDVNGDLNTNSWYRANGVSVLRNTSGTTSLRSTGAMNFLVGASGGVTAATFDSSGNLGIGTTAPDTKLHVVGTAGTTLKIVDGNQATGKVLTSDANGVASWQTPGTAQWTAAASDIYFNTGKVGIGTTAPAQALDVSGTIKVGPATLRDSHAALVLAGPGNWTTIETNAGRGAGDAVASIYSAYNNTTNITNIKSLTGTTTSTGALTFETTSSATPAERMRIDQNGYVGIGTTSPANRLDVAVGSALALGDPAGGANLGGRISFRRPSTGAVSGIAGYYANGTGSIFGLSETSGNGEIRLSAVGNSGGFLSVYTDQSVGGAEALRVTQAGNLVMGTTVADAKLHVAGTVKIADGSQGAGKVLTSDANGLATWSTAAGGMGGGGTSGKLPKFTAAATLGDSLLQENGTAMAIGASVPAWMAANGLYTTGMVYGGSLATNGYVQSTSVVGGAAASGVITIDSTSHATKGNVILAPTGGKVGIGTTSPGASYKLDVTGNVNASGTVSANGVALSSDIRWKKDVEPLRDSLQRLSRLRGVTYYWRQNEFPWKHFGPERQVGLIAQEVEKEFPEAVLSDAAGYKAVSYPALLAPVIEAVKTLWGQLTDLDSRTRAENAELKARASKLELENAALKARMDRLEKLLLSPQP